jgi:hypothetical protein
MLEPHRRRVDWINVLEQRWIGRSVVLAAGSSAGTWVAEVHNSAVDMAQGVGVGFSRLVRT